MRRTQVFLTEEEHRRVGELARREGTTRSAVIRRAIDELVTASLASEERLQRMRAARGMWADREALPDVRALRAESNKRLRR